MNTSLDKKNQDYIFQGDLNSTFRVLFLSGGENEFYELMRNSYPRVVSTNIFKKNSLLLRAIRRLVNYFGFDLLKYLLGPWLKNLDQYDFVILSVSIYSPALVSIIRKKSDIPIINWYWNPVHTTLHPRFLKAKNAVTFSFDKSDALKYNINFENTYYFKGVELCACTAKQDLCFIGADKNRLVKLLNLKKQINDVGLTALFHITNSDTLKRDKSYSYSLPISYVDLLKIVDESVGIIDFLQDGQVGISQRPMEALFLRKKLVTNDIGIVQNDFYDPQNIFVIGLNDLKDLPEFMASPYKEIPAEILKNYDFGCWVQRMSNSLQYFGMLH